MCPVFAMCTLEHFPQMVQGDLHQWRKVWFWGILLLASTFWFRTLLGIFLFYINCFLSGNFLTLNHFCKLSWFGSRIAKEIGNISKVVVGMHLPFRVWIVWVPVLLLIFLILFCIPGAGISSTWFSGALFYCCYQYAIISDCLHCRSGGEGVKNDALLKYILIASIRNICNSKYFSLN